MIIGEAGAFEKDPLDKACTRRACTRFGKRTRTRASRVRAPVRVENTFLQRTELIAEARSHVLYNLLGHVRRGRSARLNRSQRPAFVEEMKRIHDGVPRSRGIEERRNSRCKFPESLSLSSFFFSSFSLFSYTLAPFNSALARYIARDTTSEESRR